MQDTIYALATGSLASAVAVVRVSGPRSSEIVEHFCRRSVPPRGAHFRHVRDPETGELIDSALVLYFKGPSSFTGEDSVEFQVHGSRAVVARLLLALGRHPGTRMASPGEFIRRAFENGKVALTSVEGLADLIDSKTELQRQQALAQASGGLAVRAGFWRELLLEALALITAEIDFADEGEAPTRVIDDVRHIVRKLAGEFDQALSDAARSEIIRSGFRVVLCGAPNAGKSTLMNALARRDVAIVTEHAGTTRDVIEVELDLGGAPVVLCDTAGIRESDDAVEAIGIERTRRAIDLADLSVWLAEASGPGPEVVANSRENLVVATKVDLVDEPPGWAEHSISVHSGAGLNQLVSLIGARASRLLAGEPALITNARQRACVEAASRHVGRLVADEFLALELVADELFRCAESLQQLVGRIGMEDVLGSVFSRFCMGK